MTKTTTRTGWIPPLTRRRELEVRQWWIYVSGCQNKGYRGAKTRLRKRFKKYFFINFHFGVAQKIKKWIWQINNTNTLAPFYALHLRAWTRGCRNHSLSPSENSPSFTTDKTLIRDMSSLLTDPLIFVRGPPKSPWTPV